MRIPPTLFRSSNSCFSFLHFPIPPGGGGGGQGKKSSLILTERRHFLSIFDQLYPHALADRTVRLLGLDADLLEHDALGVRGPAERRRFVGRSQETLLVVQIRPATFAAMGPQFPCRVEPTRFSFTHGWFLTVSGSGCELLVDVKSGGL